MEIPLMEKIVNEATAGLLSDEITYEASGLIASIGEGVPLETIMRELYNYSMSVSSMTISRVLPLVIDEKTIDEEISKSIEYNQNKLINEIESFLQSEGN